jgi:hypothetical protein
VIRGGIEKYRSRGKDSHGPDRHRAGPVRHRWLRATSTPAIVEEAAFRVGRSIITTAIRPTCFGPWFEREYAQAAEAIEAAAGAKMAETADSVAILTAGGNAFLDAMRDPGRRRILLIDGPAVLGPEAMRRSMPGTLDAPCAPESRRRWPVVISATCRWMRWPTCSTPPTSASPWSTATTNPTAGCFTR